MKFVKSSLAACAALVTAGAFAEATADENGLTPTVWQKFDGNFSSSGSLTPTWKSIDKYTFYPTTRMGKAVTGAENKDPYTSGPTVGDMIGASGTWSFVISTKVSATNKMTTFSLGSNSGSNDNGTLLFGSGGKGKVQVAFAKYNKAAETLCSADVATSTSQFHTYALSVSESVGTFYVDGVAVATDLEVPFTPNTGGLQIFGIYNNKNTSWSTRPADSEVDDLRFYTSALTAEQVQTIAANYPVWPTADIENLWTDAAGDHLWTTTGNWSLGTVPGINDKATFAVTNDEAATQTVIVSGAVTPGAVKIMTSEGSKVKFQGQNNASITPALSLENAGSVVIDSGLIMIKGELADSGSWEIAENAVLEFPVSHNIATMAISGAGRLKITNAKTYLTSTTSFAGFSGIIHIANKGELHMTNGSLNNYLGTADIRLENGILYESNGTNVTLTNNIESIAGTTNTISTSQANFTISGKITGSGALKMVSGGRGVKVAGNASEYTGVMTFESGCSATVSAGLYGLSSVNSNAVYVFPSTAKRDSKTYVIDHKSSVSKPFCVGAIQVPNEGTYFNWSGKNGCLKIGGRSEESVLNSHINGNSYKTIKVGTSTLTIGEKYDPQYMGPYDIQEGTFIVNGTLPETVKDFTVTNLTIAAGATLGGKGTIKQLVSFAEGAKITFPSFNYTNAVDGVTVNSYEGRPIMDQPTSAQIDSTGKARAGKWKLRVRNNEDGTYTFYNEFVPRGFCVIVQ